jgi:hypothetical protein
MRGNEKGVAQNNETLMRKMALEERNGNYYYYKKEREGNRVFSKYYGKGELAALIDQLDEIERYEKAEKADLQRKSREKQEKIDRELSNLEQKIKGLTESVLSNLGFYKTKSREWRLKKK